MKSQTHNFNCEELRGIIATPMFDECFDFSKRIKYEFIIIDTIGVFNSCNQKHCLNGREFLVIDTLPSKEYMMKNIDYVIIVANYKECIFSVGFLNYTLGRIFSASYLVEKNKSLTLLGVKFGDF